LPSRRRSSLASSARPARRHGARVARAGRAVAAQIVQPMGKIDIVAAKASFADEDGDLGSLSRSAEGRRIDHHAGKPRRQRQAPQFLSFVGDAPVVEGAERREQGLRLDQRRAWRRIEESELLGRRTPSGKV
jgi:hypothetical protein